MLYGLIHQRWIISKGGLQAMVSFLLCHFLTMTGRQVRACRFRTLSTCLLSFNGRDTDGEIRLSSHRYCKALLSVVSRHIHPSSIPIPHYRWFFCPSLHAYVGAYFGTTFPHLFFQTYPELLPSSSPQPPYGMRIYIPRIYGFKVPNSPALANLDIRTSQKRSANAMAQNDPLRRSKKNAPRRPSLL